MKATPLTWIDLAGETARQVVVDREPGQYLGHVTTVLLDDKKTILAVYPKGHGKGAIVYKRSLDGGRTWSERLPTPENWATSGECPTLYRTVDRQGKKRLLLFSGLYPIRMAVSEDEGRSFSGLAPIGDYGGVVPMASLVPLKSGDHLAFFHDDGRFLANAGQAGRFVVYQVRSMDGGLTWGRPAAIASLPEVDLCEPGAVRSPDGRQIALLLRENRRVRHSYAVFSNDEGDTWSRPVELPAALTGDRHTAVYAPDGRLFISFRDMAPQSPTRGDWVAWVGTYEDIVAGRDGQYRVRLMDNLVSTDCAYPGVVVVRGGSVVAVTYGHWRSGEAPFIVAVRLTLKELDRRAAA